jgi:hypothetical protein
MNEESRIHKESADILGKIDGWPKDAMTEWMPDTLFPIRSGVYRTRMYSHGPMKVVEGWTYFDGLKWRLQYKEFADAVKYLNAAVYAQTRRGWRGLTQYEYHRARVIMWQLHMMQVEKVFGIIDNTLWAEN